MQGYKYQSEFARRYYKQGYEEGFKQGREESIKQRYEEGFKEGFRAAVLILARCRLASITPDDVAAIEAVHDLPTLTELFEALASAGSVTEVRAVLDRVVGTPHSK
jgi:hypothetical protein